MKNVNQINSILSKHKVHLKKRYNVRQLGVFGSYSRGEEVEKSDIDILVEFEKPIGLDFVLLADELEAILKLRVDLVSKGALKQRALDLINKDIIYV